MEFPGLGQHCSDPTCNQLDFLPVRCDSCQNTYCMDHYSYVKHNCPKAFAKNVQVPVCPLCNALIPGRSDELPDIRVSQHIDADCKSDKAVSRRTVYTNKCSVKGCKQKELIPVHCDTCAKNFCLRHRHPQDHTCTQLSAKPLGKAGLAAQLRSQRVSEKKSYAAPSISSVTNGLRNMVTGSGSRSQPAFVPASFQGNMSEDAALQLALQASMTQTGDTSARSNTTTRSSSVTSSPQMSQEQEDFLLAKAIAESEQQIVGGSGSRNNLRGNSCQIS